MDFFVAIARPYSLDQWLFAIHWSDLESIELLIKNRLGDFLSPKRTKARELLIFYY